MPFPFCKGWNVCLLESFQLFDELSCFQNCDKRNQKFANWLTVALICFVFFSLRDHLYQDVSFCLVWDFCMHFNSCFSSAWYSISIRAIIILTAILPESPFVHVLNHRLNAPFLWKRFFFFLLLDIAIVSMLYTYFNSVQTEKRKVCLLFLQRRIPFDCHLCEIWIDAHKHNLISAQADC